jgi:hypothetical protein
LKGTYVYDPITCLYDVDFLTVAIILGVLTCWWYIGSMALTINSVANRQLLYTMLQVYPFTTTAGGGSMISLQLVAATRTLVGWPRRLRGYLGL